MRKKPSKRKPSAAKMVRLFGTAAAALPLAMSAQAVSAQSLQTPQRIEAIDSLLSDTYAASLIAGKTFTIDLNSVFQDAEQYTYTVFVQNSPVADASVDGQSLRIGLKKAGTTNVDLMVHVSGTEIITHERFTLTVGPNYALNDSGAAGIGDVIRYFKSHAGEFKTPDDYRRLLKAAVSSSAPPVNHPPVLRNTTNGGMQTVPMTIGEHDAESFDLSDYFSDEDGDTLTYSIIEGADHPSSGSLAYGTLDGTQLVLHALGAGVMDFVVAASDGKSEVTPRMTFHVAAELPAQNSPFVLHAIGDENEFSMRYGQSATIDLSRMFEEIGEGDVVYDVSIDGGEYEGLEDSYLLLQLPGSSSASHITVRASDDDGANWTSQLITIHRGEGSDLTDKNYQSMQPVDPIDLSAYFDGEYTYEASTSEGETTAEVSGSNLTLGLQPGSSTLVQVSAAGVNGLTIYDQFYVGVGGQGGGVGSALIMSKVSDDNAFSIAEGQTATIDLSRVFRLNGEGYVTYGYDVEDGDYIEPSPHGSDLLLQTTGSSSTSHITIKASIDDGRNWTSEVITISPSAGTDLQDVAYSNMDASEVIDLSKHFDGDYGYEAYVTGGAMNEASITGSQLTLGLQPDSSSTVEVDARDGSGLTIRDEFQVNVSRMAPRDIGTQYMPFNDVSYYGYINLYDIFPYATEFTIVDYDDDKLDTLSELPSPYESGLNVYASTRSYEDVNIQVEAKDENGLTGNYTIKLTQNSAPYRFVEGEDKSMVFVPKGDVKELYFRDNEEDAIQSLSADVHGSDLFSAEANLQDYVLNVSGAESGRGKITVTVSDGLPNGTQSFDYDVYVYDDKVDFSEDDWSTSLDLTDYLDGFDTSSLTVALEDNRFIEVEEQPDSVNNAVKFRALEDPYLIETPQYGSGFAKLTVSDGTHSKDIYIYIDHMMYS